MTTFRLGRSPKAVGLILAVTTFFLAGTGAQLFGFQEPKIVLSRSAKIVGASATHDTLDYKLSLFAEGKYDTVWDIKRVIIKKKTVGDVLLSFDLSGSMSQIDFNTFKSRLEVVKDAAYSFLDRMPDSVKVGVLGWSSYGWTYGITPEDYLNTQRLLPLTIDHQSVRTYITGFTASGSTPLYTASIASATYLANFSTNAQKVLILLTDGENTSTGAQSLQDVLSYISAHPDIKVYTVGYSPDATVSVLEQIAAAGKGKYYRALTSLDLDSIYAAIYREISIERTDTLITRTPILIPVDTVRQSVDVLLGFDLSGSMKEEDGTGRWRITWTQLAALEFLNHLLPGDRVAIAGWSATSQFAALSDTADASRYYQKWMDFTGDIPLVRQFISDSLYVDGDQILTDQVGGRTLVKQNAIPGGTFSSTPLNATYVLALNRLMSSPSTSKKVLLMMTDGENRDQVPLDSVEKKAREALFSQQISTYAVGFMEGDTLSMRRITDAGGGVFFNAQNPDSLVGTYKKLSKIITLNLAATEVLIQELLDPGIQFVPGSQRVLSTTTVATGKFEVQYNRNLEVMLHWRAASVPYFGRIEVGYRGVRDKSATYQMRIAPEDIPLEDLYSKAAFIFINGEYLERPYWHVNMTDLDLSNLGLTTLPAQVLTLTKLEILDLSANMFQQIPPGLESLVNLTDLNLSGNQISLIPAVIGNLQSLVSLDLSNNTLSSLPASLTQLPALRWLDLSGNALTGLPIEWTNNPNLRIDVDSNGLCPNIPLSVQWWLDGASLNPVWRISQTGRGGYCWDTPVGDKEGQKSDLKIRMASRQISLFSSFALQKLQVYDMRGRRVWMANLNGLEGSLNLPATLQGRYILRIHFADGKIPAQNSVIVIK